MASAKRVTLVAVLSAAIVALGFGSTAPAQSREAPEGDSVVQGIAANPAQVPGPDLELDVVLGRNRANKLELRINIANIGPGPTRGKTTLEIWVPSVLVPLLDGVEEKRHGWTCKRDQPIICIWEGIIDAGDVRELVYELPDWGDIIIDDGFEVEVDTEGDENDSNNSGATPGTLLGADIVTTVLSDPEFEPGAKGTYTITIANLGDAASPPIALEIDLPEAVSFGDADLEAARCLPAGDDVRCTPEGSPAPGESTDINLSVDVAGAAAGTVTMSAAAEILPNESKIVDADPTNNSDSVDTAIRAGTEQDPDDETDETPADPNDDATQDDPAAGSEAEPTDADPASADTNAGNGSSAPGSSALPFTGAGILGAALFGAMTLAMGAWTTRAASRRRDASPKPRDPIEPEPLVRLNLRSRD